MSSKKGNDRTLDGAETIEADVINIFERLEVNGDLGTAKQVLRVNPTADAIEWNNLETLTFTGASQGTYNGTANLSIAIPAALSATAPINISGSTISLLTNMGSKSLTTTGTLTAEQLTSTDDITSTGDMICNGNINGDTNTNITNINNITAGGLIQTATLTASGQISAFGNIVGDGQTNITSINNILPATIGTTGNILCGGNLTGNNNNSTITLFKSISLKDANSFLDTNGGDLSLDSGDILGCGQLNCATIVSTGNITCNGNFMGQSDGTTNINLINSITMIPQNVASSFVGNSFSNRKTDFTNCDFSSATNTLPAVVIPSTITGNKVFSGTDISFTGSNVVLGANNQTANQFSTYGYIQQLYTTSTPTTRYDYNFGLRREVKSGFPPYEDDDYARSGIEGKVYDISLGDSNKRAYRTIKLFPSMFVVNDDQSYFNAGIYDFGTFPTTGKSAWGGIKVHTANHELWCYIDIPEGQQMKGIYLKVSNTAGTSFIQQNIKVFKKHLGKYSVHNNRQILLLNQNIPASEFASPMTFASSIFNGDLVNEFDNCMAIRVLMTSSSNILSGGYVVCGPMEDLRTKITITFSGSLQSNFAGSITQFISPNTSFGNFSFTSSTTGNSHVIYVPYTYGNEDTIKLNLTSMSDKVYTATFTNAVLDNDTSTSKTNWTNSNTGGTLNFKHLRQEVGIVLTQVNAAVSFVKVDFSNIGLTGLGSTIKLFVNSKPTGGKTVEEDDDTRFTTSDFAYETNTAYSITMTSATGNSLAGNIFEFSNPSGCSLSPSNGNWNGNNATPVQITFTAASSSLDWEGETQ